MVFGRHVEQKEGEISAAGVSIHARAGDGWPLVDGSGTPFVAGGSAGSTPFGDGSCRPVPSVVAARPPEHRLLTAASTD